MKLDAVDQAILAHVQGDLDVEERPFDALAESLGVTAEEVVSRLRSLKEKGVIREVKAILRHRMAGFRANAMAVWAVPHALVDEVGPKIASCPAVSHCYEREGFEPYTVFSMIHGRRREDIMETVEEISAMTGISEYRIYWSVRELKKTSMRYPFQEEFRDE